MEQLPVIRYQRDRMLDIATSRVHAHAVLHKAIDGHPIEIVSEGDYIDLCHFFAQMPTSRPFQLLRKQVRPWQWIVLAVSEGELSVARRMAEEPRS